MTRTISSATLALAAAAVSQPCYFLRIDWASVTTYRCSHSTRTWAGEAWTAGDMSIRFDSNGRPTEITLVDYDASYRTLILAGGATDRRVRLWQGYVEALADADPALLFDGYADGATVANGRVTISVDYPQTGRAFAPRERIGPRVGVNHLAAVGETVRWGDTTLTLQPRTVQG